MKNLLLEVSGLVDIINIIIESKDSIDLLEEWGLNENDIFKRIKDLDKFFKNEFLKNVKKSKIDFKIIDIIKYIKYVENESSWSCDWEIESFINYLK